MKLLHQEIKSFALIQDVKELYKNRQKKRSYVLTASVLCAIAAKHSGIKVSLVNKHKKRFIKVGLLQKAQIDVHNAEFQLRKMKAATT